MKSRGPESLRGLAPGPTAPGVWREHALPRALKARLEAHGHVWPPIRLCFDEAGTCTAEGVEIDPLFDLAWVVRAYYSLATRGSPVGHCRRWSQVAAAAFPDEASADFDGCLMSPTWSRGADAPARG